ncbi:polysaccharide pyruvyl transferase family protein [Photobacterium piscicola]|uniref:polysaccharide pyruvyl transferase family protein n=1 Tax=Photobacterium piscicola TaxID=1378299 RepID=UPI002E194DF4|nr:polysaccharide pyruvyl transferase family protein [Photobacterium piscicola]
MKYGILTLPLWNNYGGILQSYALKKTLNDQCVDTILINLHRPYPSTYKEIEKKLKRIIKKKFFSNSIVYPTIKESQYISEVTLQFVENELSPKTEVLTSNSDLLSISSFIDGVIVGSDQVWRPNYTPNIYNYFLDFLPNNKKKISYAASFGTDKWLFTEEETDKCKSLLKKFDSISVREKSAINLVEQKLGKSAEFVLDPTFLLEKRDYIDLINKYSEELSDGNLFTYILDRNKGIDNLIDKISQALELKPFEVMPKSFDVNFNFDDKSYCFPSVTKWLRAFLDSDFVIADSFHGCVFSIIFNKPFIAIGNKERGLSRFYSLLETFDLQERLILDLDKFDMSILSKEIDWKGVNKIRDALKEKSIDFIKSSIYD